MSAHDVWRRFVDRINLRRQAYRAVFLPGGDLSPMGERVLQDLARFCCAHKPTYRVGGDRIDPIASAVQEGRREVFLRIVEHLHLDDRFIVNLREDPNNAHLDN